jgi:hypothetical protein
VRPSDDIGFCAALRMTKEVMPRLFDALSAVQQ